MSLQRQRPFTGNKGLLESNGEATISKSQIIGHQSQSKQYSMYKHRNNETYGEQQYIKKSENLIIKKLPKNIQYDKETLYEQNIALKTIINKMNEDIKKHRIDNENLEKTIKHYEHIIEQRDKKVVQQDSKSPIIQDVNHTQLINLKHQIKEYQVQLNIKTKELDQIKKNTRTTKLQETQIENTQLKEEIKRIMNIVKTKIKHEQNDYQVIEQALAQSDNQLSSMQTNLLQSYKDDNINLSNMVQNLENENITINKKMRHFEHDVEKANYKSSVWERQVKELNKQLQYLRSDILNSGGNNNRKLSLKGENQQLKQLLEEKNSECVQNNQMILTTQKQIRELQDRLKDFEQVIEISRVLEEKEKGKLFERIALLVKENERLDELRQIEPDDLSDQQVVNPQSIAVSYVVRRQSSHYFDISPKYSVYQPIVMKKRVPRVNHYDVSEIGRELKYIVMLQQNEFEDIDEIIVKDLDQQTEISIHQICLALLEQPFSMTNAENITMVARYLVEDNMEEFILFDPQRTQDKIIVKSVFKRLIGQYKLFDESEIQSTKIILANIIYKYRSSLDQALKQCCAKKKHLQYGTCEFTDIDVALDFCDLQLQSRVREFLNLEMFTETRQMNLVNYDLLMKNYVKIYLDHQNELEQQRRQKQEEDLIEKYKTEQEQDQNLIINMPIDTQAIEQVQYDDERQSYQQEQDNQQQQQEQQQDEQEQEYEEQFQNEEKQMTQNDNQKFYTPEIDLIDVDDNILIQQDSNIADQLIEL